MEQGQTFESFSSALNLLRDYAAENCFSFEILKGDKTRVVVKCCGDDCPFRARFSKCKNEELVKLATIFNIHNCLGAELQKRGSQSNHQWILTKVKKGMEINNNLKSRTIINHMYRQHGSKISYAAAHKAKNVLLLRTTEAQKSLFGILPDYVSKLQEADKDCFVCLESTTDRRFRRIFVCPAASCHSHWFCWPYIAVDGTFMRSRFIQVKKKKFIQSISSQKNVSDTLSFAFK